MTAETIARLRISLDDIRPKIWRVVEIQTSASLKAVRDVIQAAMGWQDYHLWDFDAGGRRYGLPDPNGRSMTSRLQRTPSLPVRSSIGSKR